MSRATRQFYLFSPGSEQGYFLATLIKKYLPTAVIGGLLTSEEAVPVKDKPDTVDSITTIRRLDELTPGLPVIPTGAISTQFCLEQGDIQLGEVTHAAANLRVFDKPWLLAQAMHCGVPIPETWDSVEKISAFPLFYKQRYEQGGGVRGIALQASQIPQENQGQLIFQELISGEGTYGVGFLAHEGQLSCQHTHFERESAPRSGGSAVIIETFCDNRLVAYTKQLIAHLNYSGWGLVEFKYCPKRDDYVLMEINAKFWASCELAIVNEPCFLKQLFAIESREVMVKRLFFVERAAQRGLVFFITRIIRYSRNSVFCSYPNGLRGIFIALTPLIVRSALQSFNNLLTRQKKSENSLN